MGVSDETSLETELHRLKLDARSLNTSKKMDASGVLKKGKKPSRLPPDGIDVAGAQVELVGYAQSNTTRAGYGGKSTI